MGVMAERENLAPQTSKIAWVENKGSINVSLCLGTHIHSPSEFSCDYGKQNCKRSSAGYRKQIP